VSGIGGGLMTYSGGSVPAGGSCHCLVQVMIPSPSEFGIKTNTTSNVSATVDGKTTSSPPASDDIEILSVTVDKQFLDDPAVPGEQVTLRFTLTNGTTESATGITFTDDLEVVLDGLSPSGMFPMADVCGMGSSLLYNSGTLTLVGGSLDASGSCMFDVILNVPANAEHGEYHNITSILQATVGNESVTSPPAQDNLLVAATPNLLTLSKAFEEDQLAPGEMTNLIFEISFEGTSTATNISFSDNLNAGLQATSAANTCGATVNVGGVIDVSGGVLNPGESCTITVEVQVPNDALLGDYTNTTTAITATGGIVGNAASADFSITDGDRPPPPIADAGPDQTVECTGSDGADVMLDGTASQSFDPPLSYSWSQNAVEFSTDPQPVVTLGLGMHTISLTVSDAAGLDSDEVIITVEDTQAPVITFNGDVEVVRFNGPYMDPPGATTVFDVCDPSPSLIVDASNVDTNLPGDYPVFYTATDASGNMSTAQRMITVIEDPDAPAHPYLLLAGQNISVKEVQRLDGDMHANALISVGRGKAANQGGPTAYTSDMTAVNMITVSRNNTIHGNITSPSVSLANNVVVNGMVKQVPVDPVALPPLNFTAGGNNVTVASNGSLNLAPGSYGNLVVETGATLNLTTGDYYFSTVSLRASSILNVDIPIGPVTINSVGQILIFEDVQTIMTPLGDGESEYLRIQSLTDIFVKDRAKVLGQLIAPNGQGNLEKDVNFRGAICAKFINITLGGAEVLDHEANGPFSNLVQEVVIDQGEWVIRPNPVRGALTIIGSIPDLNKGNQIRIVDLANRTVYSSPLSTEHVQLEIATDKWTSGFYFVILQLADEVRTFKVVKVE
ncbi:MAG: DUF5011 domain-containing protein, partial [Saprospiraceae bacterium]|nr:DUF5011 domain-containing protein [Saprospiraceae bacterium]